MKCSDAKCSSSILLRISTLGRKSCLGKMGQVQDGKTPDLGQQKEGDLPRIQPTPRDNRGDSRGDSRGMSQPCSEV